MTTILSSKGQVVVPRSVRTKLGLKPGMQFQVRTEGDNVILAPQGRRKQARLKRDRRTGLPTFVVPSGTPEITSADVHQALADFP
jgi:AbrB family looped-hinge helix DNA binding protein